MIKNLQALRAAAALLVICVHIDTLLESLGFQKFGHGGVDLFFVISGFVMVYTTRPAPPSALDFMTNRILRIAPIYWLITLVVFAIAALAPELLRSTDADPVQLIKSLLFIPFLRDNGFVQPTLFVGWSLNYEMFFYALFALGRATGRYYLGLATVVATIVALCGVRLFHHDLGVLPTFYTNPMMLEFGFGMGLALAVDRAPQTAPRAVSAALLVLMLGCFALIAFGPLRYPDAPSVLICGLPATVVVGGAILLERWGLRVESPLVMGLGDASYVIYLTHPFVTQGVQKIAERLQTEGLASVAMIVVAYVGVAVVGVLVHRTVERPLGRAGRRLLAAVRPAPARQPVQAASSASD